MKNNLRKMVAALLLGAGAATMYGIPAKKGVFTYVQADGTAVDVELVGDEYAHIYVTPEGYPLVDVSYTKMTMPTT